MNEPQKYRIKTFLEEFKNLTAQGRGIYVVNRSANQEALAELGLTKKNRTDEILSLSTTDYHAGPLPDRDKPGEVWIFGKRIGENEVYIKLKIAHAGRERIAKCISFHTAEKPLFYPFKEEGGK